MAQSFMDSWSTGDHQQACTLVAAEDESGGLDATEQAQCPQMLGWLLGMNDPARLKAATVRQSTVNGNHATVAWSGLGSGSEDDFTMVRIKGRWSVDSDTFN
ncbi:hypothetical protein VV01_05620 [Luteipulveratus halotolerans]|uniref:Uncharacterized protein n=1 Tax=Luteipulveratus halotolerans TaxID=1631356 RepID=A0A0L6CG96_9MICO|nr:hypothetical protein VV01_05620 [Luteipulveratus halotolerans]